ncbi:MAG TPA: GNAT family N-acetyltransferase [Candidatus Peribacteraceae bacterium]|nr:GNAT family N-acetyltransferase [Candidatus Peribacteraceae bacterium]
MELIEPSLSYAASFEEGIEEFHSDHVPGFLNNGEPLTDVAAYIELTKKQARGEALPEGWVPATTLWLIDHDEFIGNVNIRHRMTDTLAKRGGHIGYAIRPSMQGKGYGTEMLRLALIEAQKLGIDRVLITCSKNNPASRRVIEKNGGVLQDEIDVDGEPVLRFWIDNR